MEDRFTHKRTYKHDDDPQRTNYLLFLATDIPLSDASPGGMMCSQPSFRLPPIRKFCERHNIPLLTACT